jgi:hypothetical protein
MAWQFCGETAAGASPDGEYRLVVDSDIRIALRLII